MLRLTAGNTLTKADSYFEVDPEWREKIAYAKRVRAETLKARGAGHPIQFRTGWPIFVLRQSFCKSPAYIWGMEPQFLKIADRGQTFSDAQAPRAPGHPRKRKEGDGQCGRAQQKWRSRWSRNQLATVPR